MQRVRLWNGAERQYTFGGVGFGVIPLLYELRNRVADDSLAIASSCRISEHDRPPEYGQKFCPRRIGASSAMTHADRRSGKAEARVRNIQNFLALGRDADPDSTILQQAKAVRKADVMCQDSESATISSSGVLQ